MRQSQWVPPLMLALVALLALTPLAGSARASERGNAAILLTPTATAAPSPTATPPPTPAPQGALDEARLALVPFATGLSRPLYLTHAGDGSGRVYILEQAGRILVADAEGHTQSEPFLDIRGLVRMQSELGLLSMAFHPRYKTNGLFYVAYSDHNADTVIASYHVFRGNRLLADPASAQIILRIDEPDAPEHRSGMIEFGPDGYLYIGVGDGGRGAPGANGQRTDTFLGKALRIDVDHTLADKAYAIPATNPLIGEQGAPSEIWAYGLRNPWRFSFDRATGDLYIGDVGDSTYEEIDFQPASSVGGENYGWQTYEGNACRQGNCSLPAYSAPIAVYQHTSGLCAVVGGYVYRGKRYPALQGIYLFGDWCTGRIFGLLAADNAPGKQVEYRLLLDSSAFISSFGEDEAGELYVLDLLGGKIYRVMAA